MQTKPLPFFGKTHPILSAIARALGLAVTLASLTAAQAGPDSKAISNFGMTGEQRFFVEWQGIPEALYRVQSRDHLSPDAAWKTEDVLCADDLPMHWTAREAIGSQKFYRLELPSPEIFRVEPARFPAGVATEFYLVGQCFTSNDVVRFAGEAQAEVLLINPSLLRVSVVPQTAGTYVFELVVTDSGGLSSFPVMAYDPDAPPAEILQEPPQSPPASPSSPPLVDGAPPALISAGVQLHSGEVRVESVDLVIPGRNIESDLAIDLVYRRRYHSRSEPNTAAGNRWDFSYNIFVQQQGAKIVFGSGLGRTDVLDVRADGTYAAPGWFCEGTLINNVFRITFADGGFWEFNPLDGALAEGKIARSQDRNGNALRFEYDGNGRLDIIVDTLDRTNRLSYNADGNLVAFTDFSGRAITYEYYADSEEGGSPGDLKSVTGPPVAGTPHRNDFPKGKTTTFTYTKGFPDERQNHLLLSITDPKGQTARAFAYQLDPTEPDFLRCISEQRGLPKHTIQYHYAPQTPSPSNAFAVMKTIVNDRAGNVSEHSFDSLNRLVSVREFTGRAAPGQPTTETANRPVNPLRPDDPAFFLTGFEWNNDSLCTRIIHPAGNSQEFLYERDFEPDAAPRMKGNLRVHRRIALGDVDGDGRPDVLATYFEHDPRFGSEGANIRSKNPQPTAVMALDSDAIMRRNSANPFFVDGDAFPTRIIDPRGNETRCTYDAAGNRIQIQHPIPSIVENLEYAEGGSLIARKGPANGGVETPGQEERRDEFTYYDEGPQRGYLKEQIIDAGPGRLNLTTTYEYDAVGNITHIIDPRGNDTLQTYNALNQVVRSQSSLVSADVPVRCTTLHFYDANDNLVRTSVENRDETGALGVDSFFDVFYEVDLLDRVIAVTREVDATNSVTTQVEYDANGNLSRLLKPEAVNGNDPLNVVQYQYDERDLLFRRTRAPGGALQSTDGFDYDANRNLFKTLSGMFSETEVIEFTYHYDGFSRRIGSTDPAGNGPTCLLDANGNVIRVTVFGETHDVPGSGDKRRLAETTYEYDAMNRRVRQVDSFFDVFTELPIGDGARTTQFEYTASSHLRSVTNDRGNVTQYTYDSSHRPLRVTDARGNSLTYAYDPNGNVVSLSNTNKSDVVPEDQVFVTEYQYDNFNRLTRATDNVGNATQYGYDSRGNRVSVIDPRGTPARYEYDGLSRLTATALDTDGNGGLDILRLVFWDDNSRVRSNSDPNGNVTQFTYDSLDRLVRATFADETAHTNSYDARDNLTASRDGNNTLVTMQYDFLNRVTNKLINPGPGVADTTTFERYQYDGLSRLVRAENDSATHTFVWDSLVDLGPRSETVNGRTVSYTYDALGNRLSVAYPGRQVVTYSYDSLNRVSGVGSIPFAGGALAMVVSNHYVGPTQIARRDLGNGLRTRVHYNGEVGAPDAPDDFGRGQISRIRHATPGAAPVIDERAFAYDRNQNKTVRALIQPFLPGGHENRQTFAYDGLNRLNRATVTVSSDVLRDTQYQLDLAGNRIQVTGGLCSGPYTMDETPRPGPADFQMNQYTTTGCDARQYDENGNLQATESGGKVIVRGWDYKNRLVSITDPTDPAAGVIAQYSYDALGRRLTSGVWPGTPAEMQRHYVYDGPNVIEERDDLGTVIRTFALDGNKSMDPNGFTWTQVGGPYKFTARQGALKMTQGGQDFYYHTDDLGNVLALTDVAGNVVERYEYDDYGAPMFLDAAGNPLTDADGQLVGLSPAGNPYLFHCHRWDSEAGLYLMGGLWFDTYDERESVRQSFGGHFDPATGRYIMRAGVPLAANQHTYAGDNPWSGSKGIFEGLRNLNPDIIPNTWAIAGGGGGGGGVQFMNKAQLVDLVLKNKKAGFGSKEAAERALDAVGDDRGAHRPGRTVNIQALPHREGLENEFGGGLGGVRAHTGGAGGTAAAAMGAHAYAGDGHIYIHPHATPDLHTAAHEAAHVVQQRSGR
jgi:YD repeat-containing protein